MILLGDTLGDVEMGNNLDESKFNVLKIGFLNDKVSTSTHYSCLVCPENLSFSLFALIESCRKLKDYRISDMDLTCLNFIR